MIKMKMVNVLERVMTEKIFFVVIKNLTIIFTEVSLKNIYYIIIAFLCF